MQTQTRPLKVSTAQTPYRIATRALFIVALLYAIACGSLSRLHAQAPAKREPPLVLVDGPAQNAALTKLLPTGQLVVTSAGKSQELAARDVVRWGAFRPFTGSEALLLAHGDLIAGRDIAFAERAAAVRSESAGSVRVPQAALAAIVLRAPSDAIERDRWFDQLTGRTTQTQSATGEEPPKSALTHHLFLDNGDIVPAQLLTITPDEVTAESSAGKLTLPRSQVRAIAIASTNKPAATKPGAIKPDATKPAPTPLVIGLADGSRITAKQTDSAAPDCNITALSGITFKTPIANIVAVQPLGGRAIYLSDMQPSAFVHIPFLSTAWPLLADRNAAGGRLQAGGVEYLRGLGMHSAARATYTLERPCRRFAALVAIDDQAGRQGSVQFRAYTDDGAGTWKLRWSSPVVRGGEAPLAVDLDITGAKRLSLIVDFADAADVWDRANWLEARVIE